MIRAVAIVSCAIALASCADSSPRELIIIARGMSFLVPSESDRPNPEIRLRAGERIHVVFRNEAPGLIHNFQIPAWNVRTDEIRSGQTAEVTFTVPLDAKREKYDCRPHAELMHGVVEISDPLIKP